VKQRVKVWLHGIILSYVCVCVCLGGIYKGEILKKYICILFPSLTTITFPRRTFSMRLENSELELNVDCNAKNFEYLIKI
jgi:hypothetical protein